MKTLSSLAVLAIFLDHTNAIRFLGEEKEIYEDQNRNHNGFMNDLA